MRISAVPLHEGDLVRRAAVNGFTLTEARSPEGRIPSHAHASFSLTILLDGSFEERYGSRLRPHACEPGSLLVRPAGEVHENLAGPRGARTLSLELSLERLGVGNDTLSPLLSLTLRRERPFLDIGLALSRELGSE